MLGEMLGILIAGSKPSTALPLTNEPGQRDELGGEVCRYFDRHSNYLRRQLALDWCYFWPLKRRYTTKPANHAMERLAMPSRTRKKISNASTDMMPS
jgi:hypothetical protein